MHAEKELVLIILVSNSTVQFLFHLFYLGHAIFEERACFLDFGDEETVADSTAAAASTAKI